MILKARSRWPVHRVPPLDSPRLLSGQDLQPLSTLRSPRQARRLFRFSHSRTCNVDRRVVKGLAVALDEPLQVVCVLVSRVHGFMVTASSESTFASYRLLREHSVGDRRPLLV
jgi:hypothetical protein